MQKYPPKMYCMDLVEKALSKIEATLQSAITYLVFTPVTTVMCF